MPTAKEYTATDRVRATEYTEYWATKYTDYTDHRVRGACSEDSV